MAEQKEEFWNFDNYEVTTTVLDLLSGLIAEKKKHGHILLKSLLSRLEEKTCGHTNRNHLGIMESNDFYTFG